MLARANGHLERYAEIGVKIGLNLQPGQTLRIAAPVETAALAHRIARLAYNVGARFVDVMWEDEQLERLRLQYAPRDSFQEYPAWYAAAVNRSAARGDAFLIISGRNPHLLKGQDPELIDVVRKTRLDHLRPFIEGEMRNDFNWLILSMPVPSWAAVVFPTRVPSEQQQYLWDVIRQVMRLDQPDPVAAWQQHLDNLARCSSALTARQYSALKYRGPGTDLTVGLPRNHIWVGGRERSAAGIWFVGNLPTEEVYTLPHRNRSEGVVAATKPFIHAGNVIHDMTLKFAEGKVVHASASTGEALLRKLLATDEGATRLGEVALVPADNPIARSGILFYNTLFDENAASHLALGRSYPMCLEGSAAMNPNDYRDAGGNTSLAHADFMIGSDQVDVDGLFDDDSREPLMRNGEWVLEV